MKLPVVFLIAAFVCLSSLTVTTDNSEEVRAAMDYYKMQSKTFAASAAELQQAITNIHANDSGSVSKAKMALAEARLQYKKIEFFLNYFFYSNAKVFNQPAKYEVEEQEMEYVEPVGLQYVEDILFSDDVVNRRAELLQQAAVLVTSARDLNSLLYDFRASDGQLLECIRLEVIRVATLNITGYDAPLLKTGINESCASLSSIKIVLQPFLKYTAYKTDSLVFYLDGSIQYLKEHPGFDDFDRLHFLTQHILPLQKELGLFISQNHFDFNSTNGFLNYDADNIFSKNAFRVGAIDNQHATDDSALIALGKRLFFEKQLSGNGTRSCATCHQPERYFTDGLPQSQALHGAGFVKRNAPTLLYAAWQREQFWDGRIKSLNDQALEVIHNPLEMDGNDQQICVALKQASGYSASFSAAFNRSDDTTINIRNVSKALGAYIRSLNPRTSAFDRYVYGEKNALTPQQIDGFNLFMGKGMCGTCHFAPLFNGLLPPLFDRSEVEVLNVPKTADLQNPVNDSDSGRYSTYPIRFNYKAFKTPTVRNAAKTAPYMHNGAFATLDEVMDFYNKGGGLPLGLKDAVQTLSDKPLNLNEDEMKNIISFIESLTDDIK